MMLAFVFPGQGSQTVGMAKDLYESAATARALLDELAAAVDLPLLQLMFEGPAEELTRTENAQPALLAHSVVAAELLREAGLQPAVVAGHSLGEYSALVVAGCVSPVAGVKLVRARGQLMAEAGREMGGTMAAVIGLDREALAEVVQAAGEVGVVCMANFNAPGQIVISGEEAAVEKAGELARETGARLVVPLNVNGAFHSPLMRPAAERFAATLNEVEMANADTPLVSNADAKDRREAADIRAALLAQLISSVRWEDCITRMIEMGVTDFVEVGPGKVLTNMLKRSAPEARCHSADTLEGVEVAAAELGRG